MSNPLITVPLCQLERSKANMRKTGRLAGIKSLAASIAANGLLENLVVHRRNGHNGHDAVYEVVAGGRRLEALKRLAKASTIDPNYPVPCLVIAEESAGRLTELSLTENFERVPAHPADQFEAFAKLRQKHGMTAGAIAARFGIATRFVEQRLKLAQVSRRLIAEYRKDAMTLEQLMAFTISDDPTLQERVWSGYPNADIDPSYIRRQLTQTQVEASDRRAIFIGVKAYEAAGGTIVRDLFDGEHQGYFADSQLLDRLVMEKLGQAAETLRAEGWSWVEALPEADYAYLSRFGRAAPSEIALPKEDEERLSSLCERYDALVSRIEEEDDETVNEELDRVDENINALRARKETWSGEDKAQAGALVGLERDGTLCVIRGLLRQKGDDDKADNSQPSSRKPPREGYAESVLMELSAHRTAALREAVAGRPDVAFLALLYAFVRGVFHGLRSNCIEIAVRESALDQASQTVGESKAVQALLARHTSWAEKMPESEQLWDWLQGLADAERWKLLAHCVAVSVNALRRSADDKSGEAQTLATLAGLDMAQWWTPTEAFFNRLTKTEILAAVSEGSSPEASHRLGDLKKKALAKRAEDLLATSGWLPASLRPMQHITA